MALGLTTNFIHIIKSTFHQRQNDNLDFIKLKNVCLEKDTLTVEKRQNMEGKYFPILEDSMKENLKSQQFESNKPN